MLCSGWVCCWHFFSLDIWQPNIPFKPQQLTPKEYVLVGTRTMDTWEWGSLSDPVPPVDGLLLDMLYDEFFIQVSNL